MEEISGYAGWMIAVFIIGYAFITLEHFTKINKATVAIMMGVICWVLQFAADPSCAEHEGMVCFYEHLANISQIVFFILGALTIVEIISMHDGFKIILNWIQIQSKRKLLWAVGFITFFLSSVLDNLTTTIVMITLLRQLLTDREDRLIVGSGVVIAANAGGAWTPIGDVTTTMLWIGGQITSAAVMRDLFIPSLVCMVVSFIFLSRMLNDEKVEAKVVEKQQTTLSEKFVFYFGIALLVSVPVFKHFTHLPPFMGIFFALSILWIVTDWMHGDDKNGDVLKVPHALSRIDHSTFFFFLGILLCVDALDSAHILARLAQWLDHNIGNVPVIATIIGLLSAIVDNVPLVAASMGMYSLAQYNQDSQFWEMIAYCAGTGGSILIIGSAAGVVFMGLEKVDFFWYLKRISLPALLGYLAGVGAFLLW
jgi:Na+/H+ antiporter NhaD/arsenite permease-like protein